MITKQEKYLSLISNKQQLINSSQSIIRKKKSVLARKISNGNVKAIVRAAKDRIEGSLSKEKKKELCKLLCSFKNKLINSKPTNYREIVSWAIQAGIGIIDAASGLVVSFLWVIRNKLERFICPCQLNAKCIDAPC